VIVGRGITDDEARRLHFQGWNTARPCPRVAAFSSAGMTQACFVGAGTARPIDWRRAAGSGRFDAWRRRLRRNGRCRREGRHAMKVVIVGAGFGGLETATCLSEALDRDVEVLLIDKSDSFVFGYSKLDVMFGRTTPDAIRLPYRAFAKVGVTFRQEIVTAIDPGGKRVTTDKGTYDADALVVALGADYDVSATPGLIHGGHEFYTVAGAVKLRDILSAFRGGTCVVGVMTPHYKCPPAPSEAAMLMHDYLAERELRDRCRIIMVTPFPSPLPVSKEAGDAILARFGELGIECITGVMPARVDGVARRLHLSNGIALDYDLLLAVPVHVAPRVVLESGLIEGGWIPVDRATLLTRFPDVYAIGDVTSVGTPRAGTFAEGAGRVVAAHIVARRRGGHVARYQGDGQCYIEFGESRVAEISVNFLGGPKPSSQYIGTTPQGVANKRQFGSSRARRWFGL
jgi:sulfide:quinone oxidoreductase